MFSSTTYHLVVNSSEGEIPTRRIAERVFELVFRHDWSQPGFALISFLMPISSKSLRKWMIDLKENLSDWYRTQHLTELGYQSMTRFNQQVTTKFHLDGSPMEAYLMLGYEPSEVPSRLAIADYSRAAFDCGITPRNWLDRYNPMFRDHESRLLPYVTVFDEFDARYVQIVVINNSSLPFQDQQNHSLGVLHQATILNPNPKRNRIINSTMIIPIENNSVELVDEQGQRNFVESVEIAGGHYD